LNCSGVIPGGGAGVWALTAHEKKTSVRIDVPMARMKVGISIPPLADALTWQGVYPQRAFDRHIGIVSAIEI